jgi:dolichol kinase
MKNRQDLKYRHELLRKGIHLSTSLIAVSYFYFEKNIILGVSIFLMSGFLLVDILRFKFNIIEKYFHLIFSKLLRIDEQKNQLTGATYLFIGISATLFLFEREIAIASILILTLSDTFAAIVGKKMGRNKIGDKSVEGSAAFLITTMALLFFIFGHFSFILFFIAILITIMEAVPIKINDNLTIPLFSGLLLTVFL